MSASRHVDSLAAERIDPGVKHAGRSAPGRRDKILDLLGRKLLIAQELGQFDRVGKRAAGMAGDQIRQNVLFLAGTARRTLEKLLETHILLHRRFAHQAQYLCAGVLGRHAKLAGNVPAAEFVNEFRSARVGQDVIVTQSGSEKKSLSLR